MAYRILLHISFFLITNNIIAQDTTYIKNIIHNLSSASMYGRGYVKKGDKIAAKYIENELKSYNILPFKDSYFQNVTFPINTFPENMSISINAKALKAVKQFVVSPDCPSISGKFPIAFLPEAADTSQVIFDSIMAVNYKGKFIVSPFKKRKLSYENPFKASGIIIPKSNISWWASTGYREAKVPTLYIIDSILTDSTMTISLNINNKFYKNYESQNVAAYIPGNAQPDSFIVFTAHYDHLGIMGEGNVFTGANDNASGVAMVLALANHYSKKETKPKYSTVFLFFTGEEAGLLGSKHYIYNPLFPLENIKALINLDMVGSGSEGIGIVNGKENKWITQRIQTINNRESYLPNILVRGKSCNSDHCFFHKAGVPAVFIYTQGKEHKEYHNLKDTYENLPLTKFSELLNLLIKFAE